MAQFAQDEANFSLNDLGQAPAKALPQFDKRFAAFYLGRDSNNREGRPNARISGRNALHERWRNYEPLGVL